MPSRRRRRPRAQAPIIPFNAQIAPVEVDNPEVPGGKTNTVRSLRNDQLAWLLCRDWIDQAQFAAGRRWELAYETAGIGAIRALDPLKEPVDAGAIRPPELTDRQFKAFRTLAAAYACVGRDVHRLFVEVLGEGLLISEVARRRGYSDEAAQRFFGRCFRDGLEALARAWGYATSARC